MAITYPRSMPPRLAAVTFEPVDQTLQSAEHGGRLVVVTLGPSRWQADYQTAKLQGAPLREWRAWLTSMRSGEKTFYGRDPTRLYPGAYPSGFAGLDRAGGGAFDGTATSWSVDTARTALTLNGLPADFEVQRDDLIGFSYGGTKRFLTRALESVNANGSGVWLGEVWPKIESFVPGAAVATFAEPECVMRIVPGSLSRSPTDVHGIAQASFRALQHLEA